MDEATQAAYEAFVDADPANTSRALDDPRFGTVCHSFVGGSGGQSPGMIVFLGDSTHELAGQTVPLPAWPDRRSEA